MTSRVVPAISDGSPHAAGPPRRTSSIGVHMESATVEVLAESAPYRPLPNFIRRRSVPKEYAARRGDPARGGSTREPIMTAYRLVCGRVGSRADASARLETDCARCREDPQEKRLRLVRACRARAVSPGRRRCDGSYRMGSRGRGRRPGLGVNGRALRGLRRSSRDMPHPAHNDARDPNAGAGAPAVNAFEPFLREAERMPKLPSIVQAVAGGTRAGKPLHPRTDAPGPACRGNRKAFGSAAAPGRQTFARPVRR
jgi:hypothetical protein